MSAYQNAVDALARPERFSGEHDVAQKYLEEATPAEIADYEKRLRVVTAAELLQMELPPREYILEPILQTQGTAMLYSKRGVGKTYLSLGIGCAIGAGASFLRWRAPKPRKVLYVDGEMPAVTMRERLAAIISGMDADMDPSYFRLVTPDLQPEGMPSLSGTIGQAMVEDQLAGAELVILDNLSTLCRGGKENGLLAPNTGVGTKPATSWNICPVRAPCRQGRRAAWNQPARGYARYRHRAPASSRLQPH